VVDLASSGAHREQKTEIHAQHPSLLTSLAKHDGIIKVLPTGMAFPYDFDNRGGWNAT
jgi:hypothetical protein